MYPVIKAMWLDELRGGEWEQGYDMLDRDGTNCCLGVLCEIMDIPYVEVEPFWAGGSVRHYSQDAASSNPGTMTGTNFPPQFALNLAGIPRSQAEALASMNDLGRSFEEIADYIEAVL